MFMKKSKAMTGTRRSDEDTIRAEYDFSKAVRGVTAARYAEGTNVVLLEMLAPSTRRCALSRV
jgi:hypothetical protein